MQYLTITEKDRQAAIAAAIVAREQELFGYDLNIVNYNALLEGLPKDPTPKEFLRPKSGEPLETATQTATQRADYGFRDEIRARLIAEKVERSKSERVYRVLLAQLPEEEREALVLAAKNEQPAPNN